MCRIFSGYWVAWTAAVFVFGLAGKNYFSDILHSDWSASAKALILLANTTIVGSDAMMFLSPSPDGLTFTSNFQIPPIKLYQFHYIAAAWSLPIELAFYAIAPFFVRSIPRLLALGGAALTCRYVTYAAFGEIDP